MSSPTNSELANEIVKLLGQGKIFEAKMAAICLAGILKIDEDCDKFNKKIDKIFTDFREKHAILQ